MVRINNIDKLKESKNKSTEFFIQLNGRVRSSKIISWDENEKKFYITNQIDDTEQVLTEEELFDTGYSLIGKAISDGAFWRKNNDL